MIVGPLRYCFWSFCSEHIGAHLLISGLEPTLILTSSLRAAGKVQGKEKSVCVLITSLLSLPLWQGAFCTIPICKDKYLVHCQSRAPLRGLLQCCVAEPESLHLGVGCKASSLPWWLSCVLMFISPWLNVYELCSGVFQYGHMLASLTDVTDS